jgi:uncharacterized membrane protein YozB (DUF420 family)
VNLFRTHGWRLALIASGIVMLLGGPMHPEADAKHDLREELATMTTHPDWVPAHSLIVLSTVLLAAGLVAAYRQRAWPTAQRALGVAAIAVSLYVVETGFHLAAAVDGHALQHGDQAPIAFTHVGLSILLYPVAGLAIAALAVRQLSTGSGPRRFAGVPGVVGGLMHALSVPLALVLPNAELTPLFAGSAVIIAGWAVATGAVGAPRRAALPAMRRPVTV